MTALSRRRVIAFLGGSVATFVLPARAQQQRRRMSRVGVIVFGSENDATQRRWIESFRDGLRELGWFEYRNVQVDIRFAPDVGRAQAAAAELVKLSPDVILVHSSPATRVVQQQTKTIPIVFVAVGDPVANRFVEDIARPEGNVTGITNLFPSIGGKWLQLLKEAAPRTERAALIFNPRLAFSEPYVPSIEETALSLGVRVQRIPYQNAAELIREVDAFATGPNGALIMLPPFATYPLEFMARLDQHRLPSISNLRSFANAGGLMSYGADNVDLFQRAASYVDRILRGEKPRNLPVQFPTKFEMVLNLRAAKAIGLAVPPTLRSLATELID
jgi:ABC-type uncharacterized transport system substrate-binding protein